MDVQMREFGWNKNSLDSLVLYLIIGGATFVLDLGVIYTLRHAHVHYPYAVGTGFIVATFANYVLNRRYIFVDSPQSHLKALLWFFGIAFVWLWFTVGGTVYLVEQAHIHLYIARSLVGMFVAITGYVLNSLFTFKMRR